MDEKMKSKIDAMSHEEMARAHRFSPIGSPLFVGDTGDYFAQEFAKKGGMTTPVSKKIGWDKPFGYGKD